VGRGQRGDRENKERSIRRRIMLDLIRKTVLTGVGLAAMTKDKIEELAKEFAEKGELTEKEGKDLVDDLLKKSEKARKDLNAYVEKAVRKIMKEMNIATREDVLNMKKQIKKLEKALNEKDSKG
jgi:polyhydroxyalkanoate synthesis regulator phasin